MSDKPVSLWQRFREAIGLPMRPGDSWKKADGSTLTYLGKAPDPWKERKCGVCGGAATQYKTSPNVGGNTYEYTTMVCDTHESYLDGHSWYRSGDGEWTEGEKHESLCCYCDDLGKRVEWGTCDHTRMYAYWHNLQEAATVRGRL